MKRLAWLLLALSLPAQATINGVDSSRILIPCVYGQRDSEYPAGGACNPPAPSDYIQSFASFSASSSAYAAIETGEYNTRRVNPVDRGPCGQAQRE